MKAYGLIFQMGATIQIAKKFLDTYYLIVV